MTAAGRPPDDDRAPGLPWPDDDRRLGRAFGASTAGAVAGSLVGGPLGAWVAQGVEGGGWSPLAAVLVGATIGTVLLAGLAQWIAFGDEPRRARRTSALVTSIGTLFGVPSVLVLVDGLDVAWLPPEVVLVVVLLGATVLGRILAIRR